jgi:predicted nuclease of predicted toxin-antitoxin system
VNPPKLLLDENLSQQIAVRLRPEGVDAVHVRDRGLLEASDMGVLACSFREDRMLVTSNVDDFVRLARAVQVHPGLVLIEQGSLLRDEQMEVVRRALALIEAELAGGEDMVNRVFRIWADLTYAFEELP